MRPSTWLRLSLFTLAAALPASGLGCAGDDGNEGGGGRTESANDEVNATRTELLSLAILEGSSQTRLAEIYANGSTEGGIPVGDSQGVAIGSSDFFNWFANLMWSGKHFFKEGDQTKLKNHISIVGETADALVTTTTEPFDGKPAIWLDYRKSGVGLVSDITDYMRKVGNGLYLGKAYKGWKPGPNGEKVPDKFMCFFALDFGKVDEGLTAPHDPPQDGDEVTFKGRLFCTGCTLGKLAYDPDPTKRIKLDEKFFEIQNGSRTLVMLLNASSSKSTRHRFAIHDPDVYTSVLNAGKDARQFQVSGTQLAPVTEGAERTDPDQGRLTNVKAMPLLPSH
jgi:hypothetical protein